MKNDDGMTVIGLVVTGLVILILAILVLNVAFGESGLILRKKKAEVVENTKDIEKEIEKKAYEMQEEGKEIPDEDKQNHYMAEMQSYINSMVENNNKEKKKKIDIHMTKEKPQGEIGKTLVNENISDNIIYVEIKNKDYMSAIEIVITNNQIGITKTNAYRSK